MITEIIDEMGAYRKNGLVDVDGILAEPAAETMTFSDKTLTLLVLVSLGLSALSFLVLATMAPRGRLRHGGALSADRQMAQAIKEHTESIARLREMVEQLAGEDNRLEEKLGDAVQRIGLVRYDAFEDMGGRLSFSAALLNASGDGVVITSINGRADTRCYAKPVADGASAHNLSDEEAEAIRLAMSENVAAAS
ncbi:MAG TPA: DUF4446 family protein [Actinomycetota bacterium]|nr:DUF4446 family protein [Actinomycetota bacterium]